MQDTKQINWQTQEDIQKVYENDPRDIVVVYSADWCKGCVRLKTFLNNNATKLNKNMYFIYKDCTDGVVDNVDTYPRIYVYTKDSNTIMIEGYIEENKIKSILELN